MRIAGTPLNFIARASRFGAVAILVLLAGCESVNNAYDNVSRIWSPPVIQPCPDYRILADAARVVQFRPGPGQDLVDVSIDGELSDLHMECRTEFDKETQSGAMEVAVTVSFGAKRGPANADKQAILPYFISVTDHNRNVLYREEFQVVAGFPGNRSSIFFAGEPVRLELPLSEKISSADYSIYAGFKLSREQLEYNRRIKTQRRL